MTKTIEEAAREAVRKEYLCEKCAWKENCDFCGGENTAFDCCECPADSYEDGFKAGAKHVYDLPLASRLTTKEKERVRKIFTECELIEMDDSPNLPADRITEATAKIQVLESIFGADFFKEGE